MQGQELNSVLETEVKGKCKEKSVKSNVDSIFGERPLSTLLFTLYSLLFTLFTLIPQIT